MRKFKSKIFLAPMSGVTDPALRLLCHEYGAGLTVVPLISIHSIVAKGVKGFIQFSSKEKPRAIQLFGSDLELLKKAVKIVEKHFDIIDYNMGCPSLHVTEQMACSALLQKPELTRKIFQTMVKSTKKPVTVKMRTGISKPNKFLKIAKIAQEERISMLTLHARTVKQKYSGHADWKLIKKLKASVSIPVVGNGDVETPEDAQKMLEETGCDYVMVGRAASKNPFLFKQINDYLEKGKYSKVSSKAKLKSFFKYLDYAQEYNLKPSQIRMQAMSFSSGCKGSKKLRGDLLSIDDVKGIRKLMTAFHKSL